MKDHLFIITGASKGLGAALVHELMARGDSTVIALARTPQPQATECWCVDLSHPGPVAERLHAALRVLTSHPTKSLNLINNAAVLPQPGPLESQSLADIGQSLRVGLEAPTLLTAAFLQASASWAPGLLRRVLHVSSGLGRRAMAGSAAYCAQKAGLDHLARAQALEQAQRAAQSLPAARVVSLAPGVIDTGMQVTLRSADPMRFPEQAMFESLSSGGQLSSPQATARAVLRYLDRPDFGVEAVADIRNA